MPRSTDHLLSQLTEFSTGRNPVPLGSMTSVFQESSSIPCTGVNAVFRITSFKPMSSCRTMFTYCSPPMCRSPRSPKESREVRQDVRIDSWAGLENTFGRENRSITGFETTTALFASFAISSRTPSRPVWPPKKKTGAGRVHLTLSCWRRGFRHRERPVSVITPGRV